MSQIIINYQTTLNQLQKILKNPSNEYIHYHHEKKLSEKESLITEARKNQHSYNILIELANNGFYLFRTKRPNISSFVQHNAIPKLWHRIKEGDFHYSENGLIYSLTTPEDYITRNLLVIFSSINTYIYMPSLMRMFTQNFLSLNKYISKDTAILRIADLGGVIGSYYRDSFYLPNNEINIQNLIKKISFDLKVENTILYGGSRGGTGAILHGILGNYPIVTVDPILTDFFDEKIDTHFTKNLYPETKQSRFTRLFSSSEWTKNIDRAIITSSGSPQFKFIQDILLKKYSKQFSIFLNENKNITTHPAVSANSIHFITTLINLFLNGISCEKKYHTFT